MNRGISQPKERSCSVGCRCGTALKTTCFALSTEASGINKRFLVAALNAENLCVLSGQGCPVARTTPQMPLKLTHRTFKVVPVVLLLPVMTPLFDRWY